MSHHFEITSYTDRVGFGYPWTPYRIEHRPTYEPHSREELLSILDTLAECGVKAWWYAVATKGGYPFIASKHLPHREDTVDYIPWLVEEGHKRGIAMFAWHYFATAPFLAARHEKWGWRYFDGVDPTSERDRHYFCHNSPYGELMCGFSEEVVCDFGFDGIWYDGSLLFQNGEPGKIACCCRFCESKYRDETGREIPREFDLNNPDFCFFLEWRQTDYMDYWRRLSQRVKAKKPEAIIAFNHFNRFNHHTESGSPLLRLAGDVPVGEFVDNASDMPAMVASERGNWQQHASLMAKTLRAINDNYPPELWIQTWDAPGTKAANVDTRPLLYHAQMCATAGAFASYGVGGDLNDFKATLKTLSHHLNPLAPYVGGDQTPCVGVVQSGATKDYAYRAVDGKSSFPGVAWKSVFGTETILGGLHLPSEILLDNMLCDEFLSSYQAIILPEVQCLSDESAAALVRYVEAGGFLLAVGDTGTRTRLGEERTRGVLDDLFGITWRAPAAVRPLVEPEDADLVSKFAHAALPDDRPYAPGIPLPCGGIAGLGRLVQTESAEVLAVSDYQPPAPRKYGRNGLLPPDPVEKVPCASMLARRQGKGRAVYVVPNIASDDAQWGPKPVVRELYARLLLPHLQLPFTTDAPPDVWVTLWQQEGRRVFHLLKLPANCRTLPWFEHDPWPPEVIVAESLPVEPITITLPDNGREPQVKGLGGLAPRAYSRNGRMIIELPAFDTHATVILEEAE